MINSGGLYDVTIGTDIGSIESLSIQSGLGQGLAFYLRTFTGRMRLSKPNMSDRQVLERVAYDESKQGAMGLK